MQHCAPLYIHHFLSHVRLDSHTLLPVERDHVKYEQRFVYDYAASAVLLFLVRLVLFYFPTRLLG